MTDRREFLDRALRAAAISGAAELFPILVQASAAGHSMSMAAGSAPPAPAFVNSPPRFFDAKQFSALEAFTEILIPTDDTPGAREAHCAHFIDFLVGFGGRGSRPAENVARSDADASGVGLY